MKNMIQLVQRFFVLNVFGFLVTSVSWSQENTLKLYTNNLDSLWSKNLYLRDLSYDGTWVTFTETFDLKEPITHIYNTNNNANFKLDSCEFSRLSNNNIWFSYLNKSKELHIIQLNNGSKTILKNVTKYDFSNTEDYIAIMTSEIEGQKTLLLKSLITTNTISIENIIDYQWHPKKNSILITTKVENDHLLKQIDLDKGTEEVVKNLENSTVHYLKYSTNGNAFAFIERDSNNQNELNYKRDNHPILELNNRNLNELLSNNLIAFNTLSLSDNGENLFFYRTPKHIAENIQMQESVEIWYDSDVWVYPQFKLYQEQTLQYQLTVWHPLSNKVIEIATSDRPSAIFSTNHSNALTFNRLAYEPLYKIDEMVDFFITNLDTGLSKKIIEFQYTGYNFVKISPSGRFITYFKNNQWWLYDSKLHENRCLTTGIDSAFHYLKYDKAGEIPPYGNPGWSADESKIFIYDEHDIWMISPDGKSKTRLTNGKEKNKTFRFDKSISPHSGYFSDTINFEQSLLLYAEDEDQNSGYYLINPEYAITEIVYESKKHSKALISKNRLVYLSESYQSPISIHAFDYTTQTSKKLYHSNKELMNYDIGKSRLINFKNSDGDSLKGVLIYPAQFNPSKKYPMVVHIYERMSNSLYDFEPPSDFNIRGFNPIKFAVNGYFLFYPDIEYKIKNPGFSALDCITSGINHIARLSYIDKDRMGLIGQSFGGYETLFTITNSDIFAAAVAGASTTDYISRYHSLGSGMKPEIYRFENHQHRMGDSFYNLKEDYFKNSPLYNIENLNTPVMLWSGKEDYHVNWTQSVAFFIGMKRLNKEGQLLLYKNEGHALINKTNQKHLSGNVFDWFNKHLKQ